MLGVPPHTATPRDQAEKSDLVEETHDDNQDRGEQQTRCPHRCSDSRFRCLFKFDGRNDRSSTDNGRADSHRCSDNGRADSHRCSDNGRAVNNSGLHNRTTGIHRIGCSEYRELQL